MCLRFDRLAALPEKFCANKRNGESKTADIFFSKEISFDVKAIFPTGESGNSLLIFFSGFIKHVFQ